MILKAIYSRLSRFGVIFLRPPSNRLRLPFARPSSLLRYTPGYAHGLIFAFLNRACLVKEWFNDIKRSCRGLLQMQPIIMASFKVFLAVRRLFHD